MKRSKNEFLKDGLIIALCTAYVHVVAYVFELGYSSYFEIPSYFIEVNATSLVGAALGIVAVQLIIFAFAAGVSRNFFHNKLSTQGFATLVTILWLLLSVIITLRPIRHLAEAGAIFLLILLLSILAIQIYGQLVRHRMSSSGRLRAWNRLLVIRQMSNMRLPFLALPRLVQKKTWRPNRQPFTDVPIATVLVALFIMADALTLGERLAAETRPLTFLYKNARYALITNYGDKYLNVKVSESTCPQPVSLLVLTSKDISGLTFHLSHQSGFSGLGIKRDECIGCKKIASLYQFDW